VIVNMYVLLFVVCQFYTVHSFFGYNMNLYFGPVALH